MFGTAVVGIVVEPVVGTAVVAAVVKVCMFVVVQGRLVSLQTEFSVVEVDIVAGFGLVEF